MRGASITNGVGTGIGTQGGPESRDPEHFRAGPCRCACTYVSLTRRRIANSRSAVQAGSTPIPVGAASRNQGAAGLPAGGGKGWAEIERTGRDAQRRCPCSRAARQDRNGQERLPSAASRPRWVYQLFWTGHAEPLDGASTAHFGISQIVELPDRGRPAGD